MGETNNTPQAPAHLTVQANATHPQPHVHPAEETAKAHTFITRWTGVTASELATAQSFVIELCALLGVDQPHPTPEQNYMFERPVTFSHGDGSSSAGRIDCYKRGHFALESDFVAQVLAVLDATGASPRRLKLELTESLLVSNLDEVIEKMFALKAKGVDFSLDDFGTGFSSLSYLKRLPLDQLKIDQSFVRDVLNDPNDTAIVKTIIALALANSLGLGVIAEGVETAAQRDFLSSAGCHAYQGYFFSRPLPLVGFEQLVQRDCLRLGVISMTV